MYNKIFETSLGRKIYSEAENAIRDCSMCELIKDGVLVGFSGGADSVMLLNFLLEFRKNNFDFPIAAVHLNHGIRGDAADADESFCKDMASELGVEFISLRRDVPSIAKENKLGLEEAARNERYSAFQDIIRGRTDISCVAVAHNATDNLETVLFNMLRGSGVRGLCGIAPRRDNIIRPPMYSSGESIRRALDAVSCPYVVDATNLDTEYTRNYIRHEILPKLRAISPNPEGAVCKCSANLRSASEFISSFAKDFLSSRRSVFCSELSSLAKAPFAEVIRQMALSVDECIKPESVHIDAIYGNLDKENYSISLPGGFSFVAERGICKIVRTEADSEFSIPLNFGENDFPEYFSKIIVSFDKCDKTYSNVYNFSIQAAIPFDIIKGGMFIRNKRDGDSYRTSGMTKKVKRMLCDAEVPRSLRSKIPVLCDDDGILWIPGFKTRDFEAKQAGKTVYITLVITDLNQQNRFFAADKRSFG